MTNTHKIVKLMADGKPRTKRQIALETGLGERKVEAALGGLRKRGHAKSRPVEYLFDLTATGLGLADRVPMEPELLARKNAERLERERMAKLRKAVNTEIAAEMDRERAERAAEKAEFRRMREASRRSVCNAMAGAIPNSVFALGGRA